MSKYVESTLDCNPNNKDIQKLVNRIINKLPKNKRNNDKAIATAIWNWNTNNANIHYYTEKGKVLEYGGTRFGSDALIKMKSRDRDTNSVDHANLAVVMFRAAGIPAKYYHKQDYFKVNKKKERRSHAWGMVYFNNGWHHANTVRKGKISMGAQKSWLSAETVYNDTWVTKQSIFNYNGGKYIKVSGKWYQIYQSVIIGSATYVRYYGGFFKKYHIYYVI